MTPSKAFPGCTSVLPEVSGGRRYRGNLRRITTNRSSSVAVFVTDRTGGTIPLHYDDRRPLHLHRHIDVLAAFSPASPHAQSYIMDHKVQTVSLVFAHAAGRAGASARARFVVSADTCAATTGGCFSAARGLQRDIGARGD